MKISIEYSMPDDKEDLMAALKANQVIRNLEDLDNWLRGKFKYGNETHIEIGLIREKINQCVNQEDIDFE